MSEECKTGLAKSLRRFVMGNRKYLFTSESVTEGHPDKIADQVSDAVLDAIIKDDPTARVACETLLTTGLALVSGEITTNCYVDIPSIVRNTIKDIGYTSAKFGFDYETCSVLTAIHSQSPDIAMGVDTGGAGDQGLMFGYASNETEELMPLPILLSHKLTKKLSEARKTGVLPYLRPDGKAQVTVEYNNGKPSKIMTVVVSTQHSEDISLSDLRADVIKYVIKPVLPASMYNETDIIYHINPTGRFVLGGPHADTGLTGRKIIVDTYGGTGRHGGGAFSGKDPSKVDRSACYMARYIAKNVVAAGLADKCEVQIAYAIGVQEPVSVTFDGLGTEKIPVSKISEIVRKHLQLSPKAIIEKLDLRRPIYKKTAAYGHFGRNEPEFKWEATDLAQTFKAEAGI